jgi:hypothetical protein
LGLTIINSVKMDMKLIKGTLFGGISYFLLGWLVYGILLMDFNSANMNQCASRPSGDMIWWAIIVSNLLIALLLTLILKWSGARGIADGLKTGALFGILLTLSFDLSSWSMTTMYSNFGSLMADVLVSTLILALVGMIIVLVRGKEIA